MLRLSKAYRRHTQIPAGVTSIDRIKNRVKIYPIENDRVLNRELPLTTDEVVYWKFEHLVHESQAPIFVLDCKNWRVWGNQGAVITSDGYLLKEVSREFEKPDHSIFKQFKLFPAVPLAGTSAVINASGAEMYYHWMVDILPRIKLIKDIGLADQIDHYIVDYRGLPFQRESLAALSIREQQLSVATDHFKYHVKAQRLIVPTLPSKLDTVSAAACDFLVATFLNKRDKSSLGKRIYLKRTQKRRLINGEEIETYLQGIGFQIIECEHYTVSQQAAIFHHADIIVGPHGAAFTNTVFCKPGSTIVEFFSPRWINPCYWTISNERALKYYYLIGEGEPPDAASDARGTNADIWLSIDKVRTIFNQILQ